MKTRKHVKKSCANCRYEDLNGITVCKEPIFQKTGSITCADFRAWKPKIKMVEVPASKYRLIMAVVRAGKREVAQGWATERMRTAIAKLEGGR
jgi:uncharacterized Zn finger protein (UPF0148 family)